MGTMAGCLKQLGITGPEADELMKMAGQYRAEKFDPQVSNERAVIDAIRENRKSHKEIVASITDAMGKKKEPPPEKPPDPPKKAPEEPPAVTEPVKQPEPIVPPESEKKPIDFSKTAKDAVESIPEENKAETHAAVADEFIDRANRTGMDADQIGEAAAEFMARVEGDEVAKSKPLGDVAAEVIKEAKGKEAVDKPKLSDQVIKFAERGMINVDELKPQEVMQPRDAAFSEATYKRLNEDFNAGMMDDVVIWKDPKTGEWVPINHSRYEFLKDKADAGLLESGKEIPYRVFEGTRQEAIDYARNSNDMSSQMSLPERLKEFKRQREEGKSLKDIAKSAYHNTEELNNFEAWRHLNSKGQFMFHLENPLTEKITGMARFAKWVGELRKENPEKLTNAHETQLFDFLFRGDKKNNDILREDFFNLVQGQLDDLAFDKTKPLLLKRGEKVISGTKARPDTAAIMAKIEEAKEKMREAKTKPEKEYWEREVLRLREGVDFLVKNQATLDFGIGMNPAMNPVMLAKSAKFVLEGLNKMVSAVIPRFFEQTKNRFKSIDGISWGQDLLITDNRRGRRWGQVTEEAKQATHKMKYKWDHRADGVKLGEDIKAGRAPEWKKIYDKMYFTAKAVGIDVAEYVPNYLPRILRHDVAKIINNDLLTITGKELALKDAGFADALEARLTKTGGEIDAPLKKIISDRFNAGKFKDETLIAIRNLMSSGAAKNPAEAVQMIKQGIHGEAYGIMSNLKYSRTNLFPEAFYETDAFTIFKQYVAAWSKNVAEVEMWGSKGERLLERINKIRAVAPEEATLANNITKAWTGKMMQEYRQQGGITWPGEAYAAGTFGTKILLGRSPILQALQTFNSVANEMGYIRTTRGIARLAFSKVREGIRSSGALGPSMMQAFTGIEPSSLMGKYYQKYVNIHPFTLLAEMNQYIAASTAELFIKEAHRTANSFGSLMRVRWAEGWLKELQVDPKKPLTENAIMEGMYRYANDSQLLKNPLNEQYVMNTPRGRTFVLLKRYGVKAAMRVKDVYYKRELLQNGNPLPLLRLAVSGVVTGEVAIWAMNKLQSALSGQPVYRKDEDQIWQRMANDIAAVGAVGMIGDMATSSVWSDALKRAVTPVILDDIANGFMTIAQIGADVKKYEDAAIVLRRAPDRIGKYFGSMPNYLSKRARTPGQTEDDLEKMKGDEKGEVLKLWMDGKYELAMTRVALWNQYYPQSKMTLSGDDIGRKTLEKYKY